MCEQAGQLFTGLHWRWWSGRQMWCGCVRGRGKGLSRSVCRQRSVSTAWARTCWDASVPPPYGRPDDQAGKAFQRSAPPPPPPRLRRKRRVRERIGQAVKPQKHEGCWNVSVFYYNKLWCPLSGLSGLDLDLVNVTLEHALTYTVLLRCNYRSEVFLMECEPTLSSFIDANSFFSQVSIIPEQLPCPRCMP